jgi:hypothetical protein
MAWLGGSAADAPDIRPASERGHTITSRSRHEWLPPRHLATGMPCRGAASSIRSGRSDCSSGRGAAGCPRATDCRRRETAGTSGAPSLRDSTCCRRPPRPDRNRGDTSGSVAAWLLPPGPSLRPPAPIPWRHRPHQVTSWLSQPRTARAWPGPSVASCGLRPACACASRKASRRRPAASSP